MNDLRKTGPDGKTPHSGGERLLKALIVKRGLGPEHLRAAALLIVALEEFVREEQRADKRRVTA